MSAALNNQALELVHQRLAVAVRLLDQSATEIRDANIKPVRDNIKQVGIALAKIFELQHSLYQHAPELKPDYLDIDPPSPEFDGLLTKHLGEALKLEHSGDTEAAIEKLQEFLLLETSPEYQEIARSEISRMKDG